MYERMLDKSVKPSFEEMKAYCGGAGELFQELRDYLITEFGFDWDIRFPYGKAYGWGLNMTKKKKHVCDVFAEAGAFNVLIKLSQKSLDEAYPTLNDYSKQIIDEKYPCNDGGWLKYRVTERKQLEELKSLIAIRK